ncbi:serine carboxypeptidase-like 51 [Carex littledalei]|uniref:Carboxypeptidase n=1 Tax=Carex littledalei TaxID=544730 RepID=A0A833V2B7_9POAL|nr:serine carboxypeptidase-like 51 [Carex littledalei]
MVKCSSTSVFLSLLFLALLSFYLAESYGTADGMEQWGYAQVRPKAHMFWWLYKSPQRIENGPTPWPTVLWLQGGPGASGVGIGNFEEIGPLDYNLKPRNSTWLQFADLLFVDNPVGTGYSFVESSSLLVTTDEAAASDLTELLKQLYNKNPEMQKSPLYIFAESYGGKYAVTLGLSIVKAVKSGELKLKLGGVAIGDSWISPEDFVFSWGPLLLDVSRLDSNAAEKSNSMAEKIKEQIEAGEYGKATNSWGDLENYIISNSNSIDFYNFLLDSDMDPLGAAASNSITGSNTGLSLRRYSRYLSTKVASASDTLSKLMNGVIKDKLKIIPKNITWQEESNEVFTALSNDFMKPRINEVDELLSLGVNVTIYSGQLDIICSTKGTEAWVQKLKWDGLKNFTNLARTPLYCNGSDGGTKGFYRSYRNFHFYWVMHAGHFVPYDQPCIALRLVKETTQSPASY